MRDSIRWILILLGIATFYAAVRYHIFGGVAYGHFPLFIANKALSLASVFLFAASFLVRRLTNKGRAHSSSARDLARTFGQTAFLLAAVHSLFSLLLLSPEYYPKFYLESGRFNLTGELSLALGVISFWCFCPAAIGSFLRSDPADQAEKWKTRQKWGCLGFVLTGFHVLTMGWEGWLHPGHWHGGLPPISLVAFLVIAGTLLWKSNNPRSSRDN